MKKLVLLSIAALALSLGISAQTAKVIALSAEDAKEAKTLDEQQKALDARHEALKERIVAKYLTASKAENSNSMNAAGARIKVGWQFGDFIFSEDFKFTVPSAPLTVNHSIFGECSYVHPLGAGVLTAN